MQYNIDDLSSFYDGKYGKVASKFIAELLKKRWENLHNLEILGFGYTCPLLDYLCESNLPPKEPTRIINYNFPDGVAQKYTPYGKNISIIGEPENLPFAENSFDRILLCHALEETGNPQKMLRELWRVLRPEGRIVFIVPNRRGLLARMDNTPFGQGRPYSKSQFSEFLTNGMFEINLAKRVLFLPPIDNIANEKAAKFCEEIGQAILPHLGGLLFFEATKRIAIEPDRTALNKNPQTEIATASYFSKHDSKQHKI
jgi:SAM-dependent methyltransferase